MNHLNKYTQRFGIELQKDEAFVLVSEEFGYKYWFWFPQVSQKELIKIWKNSVSIDKFNFHDVLPGKFILAGGANIEWNIREDLFDFLYGTKLTWSADIFDDCDSVLITTFPRRYIYHKGRHEAILRLETDIRDMQIEDDLEFINQMSSITPQPQEDI
jgi:hypothetical protein